MKRFYPGQMVKIVGDLSQTQRNFGKDEEGEMDSMRGKTFQARDTANDWVTIRGPRSEYNFTFHPDDIEEAEPIKEEPQVFEFDEKHLDI